MNIINIAWKEIKSDFRDIRTLVFLLAFPIVLMLILGTALSNTFSTSIQIDDMNVLYKDQANGELSQYFTRFVDEAKQSGIHFKKALENESGKKAVKQNKYDGYLEVNQKGIQLYLNERNSIEGSILQGMLTSFVDKYNVAQEVVKIAPDQMGTVFSTEKHHDYIKNTSLLPEKAPGSMDYYAIVMTTMIALYGAMSASSLISGERARKTGDRLIVSPVRKSEIFIGKVAGSIVLNMVCILIVVLFSKILFNANWGDHYGILFLVLLTEVIFAVSLGLGLSYVTKSTASTRVILMLVIQLASFFGGAYFKIENPEGFFKFITELSPLTWINRAVTKIIYANDLSAAIPAISLNIGIAILFLLISVISMRRREGL
ncbi:ABC transporter permease [Heyndrickxia sporothermodurans]|uniref:ABC transporter permease n=1 Tax=Heyndrickxia sporothermodurans TaxID=46224 RepID=UPI0035DC6A49